MAIGDFPYCSYFGHGVQTSDSLSASYLPEDANRFDMTRELSGVPNYLWVDNEGQTNADLIAALREECLIKKDGDKTAKIGFAV